MKWMLGGWLLQPTSWRRPPLPARRGRFGIDTEFMSEGRYRALLCLVQVAVDNPQAGGAPAHLPDRLARRRRRPPLAELLGDPSIEVVLHAGRQDVAILRRAWQTELNNIFDTQIAAGFAGASAQAGYGNLLGSMLGLRVGKTASYTRWDARPLTGEQLGYAAEDVAHLLQLADEIQRRLGKRAAGVGARGVPPAGVGHRRARSGDRLGAAAARRPAGPARPRGRARAGRLARAHRIRAGPPRGLDPRRSRRWSSSPSAAPAASRAWSRSAACIRPRSSAAARPSSTPSPAGCEAPPIPRDEARARSEPSDAPLIALAEALLRARALEAGLAYELIASRAELELIVGAARRGEPEPDVRTLTGWRRELVGDDLRDLLAGAARCRSARAPPELYDDPVSSMSESAESRSNMTRLSAIAIGGRALDPAEVDALQIVGGGGVGQPQLVARGLRRRLRRRCRRCSPSSPGTSDDSASRSSRSTELPSWSPTSTSCTAQ